MKKIILNKSLPNQEKKCPKQREVMKDIDKHELDYNAQVKGINNIFLCEKFENKKIMEREIKKKINGYKPTRYFQKNI